MDIESELRQAMTDTVGAETATSDLVEGVWRKRRRHRVRNWALVAAGAIVVVAAAIPTYGALTGDSQESVVSSARCTPEIPSRVLPEWARGGFSEKEPRMPYVLGEHGDIIAILFGNPLASPPRKDVNNKILWVSRPPLTTSGLLTIKASLPGGTMFTTQVPGGPGPSIIDLPTAGCWHLTLTWSQHTDTMDLLYSSPPS